MSATPTVPPAIADPHGLGHDHPPPDRDVTGHGEGGPAETKIVVAYGFWIFLLSDIIMFAAFFAAYAVLVGETAGGPTGRQLFHLPNVALETGCLLASSFACGMASLAIAARRMGWAQLAFLVTGLLGATFLLLEAREFADMAASGAGPQRSAFLSAFFTLVGTHGLHVGVGLLWLGTMMAQLWAKGPRDDILRRTLCFTLFWHALDIVWIAIFTIVYLIGTLG